MNRLSLRCAALAAAALLILTAPAAASPAEGEAWQRLDGGPGELVQRDLPSPAPCAMGMAWDGRLLWVSDRREDMLYGLDPATGAVSATLPSPGYQPTGLAWDGECLWCADREEGRLYRIDTATGLVLRSVEAPRPDPHGLAWDGERLWVADGREKVICRVDPQDGTTIVTIPAPLKSPNGLAFSDGLLWCSDRRADRIHGVDPRGGEVLITLHSPGPYPTGLASSGDGLLWAVDYQTDRISLLGIKPDVPTLLRDAERHATIRVTTDVLNFGPDRVETLDIYLAVPGNLDTQTLLSNPDFTPAPTETVEDQWSQPAAHFHFTELDAGDSRRVRMEVEADIYRVRYMIYPDMVGPLNMIPDGIRQRYLADSVKYDISHPQVRSIVEAVVGDEKNPYWIARKIFRYLIDHLHYELAGGWETAPAVLERGNGSCSEYTFCFISLCRAAGLPARYAGSVVVRGDDASHDDVFHRWAEVYLPNYGWVPVDPSGGDQEHPAEQAAYFGELANRFLITTRGGGGSTYLGWDYNGTQQWTSRGRTKLRVETVAEWEPVAARPADGEPSAGERAGAACGVP